ncbi:hypothetical protein [Variovorax boronicumulans]
MSSYTFNSPRSGPGMDHPLADPLLTSGSRPTMGTCRPDLRRLVRPSDPNFVISGSMGPKHRQYVICGLEIAETLEEQLAALRHFPENTLRFDAGEKMGNIIVTPDCWVTCAPSPWGLLGQFQMEINVPGDDGLRRRPADPLNPLVQATAL